MRMFFVVGLMLFFGNPSKCQSIRNIVFEGGGIRGIAYSGTLQILQEHGLLDSIIRVGGTSVGAIYALGMAVGFSPDELTEMMIHLPINRFNDGRWMFAGGFYRIFHSYGWYRGEKLFRYIGDLVNCKTGNSNLTFGELHDLALQGRAKDLYVMVTDLTQQKSIVLCYENYPEMPIATAVRISISIPLYFRAAFMDNSGNIYWKRPASGDYHVLIDGGILSNYPIHLFDSVKYYSGKQWKYNKETLGIKLDAEDQIVADSLNAGLAPQPIRGIKSYTTALYTLIIEELNRQSQTEYDRNRTISVSTCGYGPRIRRMPEKEKNDLLSAGRRGASNYIYKMTKKRGGD